MGQSSYLPVKNIKSGDKVNCLANNTIQPATVSNYYKDKDTGIVQFHLKYYLYVPELSPTHDQKMFCCILAHFHSKDKKVLQISSILSQMCKQRTWASRRYVTYDPVATYMYSRDTVELHKKIKDQMRESLKLYVGGDYRVFVQPENGTLFLEHKPKPKRKCKNQGQEDGYTLLLGSSD